MHLAINIKNKKTYGILAIILIFIFSAFVYTVSLSITAISAVYTFFMIKAVLLVYSNYLGFLDKKGLLIVALISFFTIYCGYYLAYVYYYFPYFNYQGYSFFTVLFNLVPLVNNIDKDSIPGSLFFISFTYVAGLAMNYQYVKHERVDEIKKRLAIFKKEVGMDDEIDNTNNCKKAITSLIIVGFLTIALGLFNDYRFSQVDKHAIYKKYSTELDELRLVSQKGYDDAKRVLDNRKINYNYSSNEYYVRGDNNTLKIYANLNGENYFVYYEQEAHGTLLSLEWGDWQEANGEYTLIPLYVKANGEGYAIITITNSVNDDRIYIFVDNFNYHK